MLEDMFTPCLKTCLRTCLHLVWRHVYTMFEDIQTWKFLGHLGTRCPVGLGTSNRTLKVRHKEWLRVGFLGLLPHFLEFFFIDFGYLQADLEYFWISFGHFRTTLSVGLGSRDQVPSRLRIIFIVYNKSEDMLTPCLKKFVSYVLRYWGLVFL